MYDEIREYVRDLFESNDPYATSSIRYTFRNRFEHTMRVYRWSIRICKLERGRTDIVAAAALFHDTGKIYGDREKPHAAASAEICASYLEQNGYDSDFTESVISAVANHSSKQKAAREMPLEDSILIDADLMDEAGALAVLWDSMATALEENPTYYRALERHRQYYEVLREQRAYLKTQSGKKLFEERLSFLLQFIVNLEYELGLS